MSNRGNKGVEGDKSDKGNKGVVYLVGAGPGDIGLFTLRGMELLREAEVVVHDGLANAELLRHAPAGAEIVSVDKRRDVPREQRITQREINALLIAKARGGRRVVRLKGGAPFVFGRGGEEAEALAEAGAAFEVVPGVSSFYSVPAYAGIPVTHRGHSSCVTVVPGHEEAEAGAGAGAEAGAGKRVDWAALARLPGTLVILMGLRSIARTTAMLLAHGRVPETPVAVISRGTLPDQRVVTGTLATIAGEVGRSGLPTPGLIVVGEVAGIPGARRSRNHGRDAGATLAGRALGARRKC